MSDVQEALEWYAEQVAGCRKLGHAGDAFRQALDHDGGKRAAAALHALTTLAAERDGLREKDRRDAAVLDDALNAVQELQAKLAAAEALLRECVEPIRDAATDCRVHGHTTLAANRDALAARIESAIDAIAKEAS